MRKFKVVKIEEDYSVFYLNFFGSWKPFMLRDINFTGALNPDFVGPMIGTEEDCNKVLRFLKHCKKIKHEIYWKEMDRLAMKLGITYHRCYAKVMYYSD